MQARAKQLVDDTQALASQKREYDREIEAAEKRIADLDCDNVPSVTQSVGEL
jgi:hypothetical protein